MLVPGNEKFTYRCALATLHTVAQLQQVRKGLVMTCALSVGKEANVGGQRDWRGALLRWAKNLYIAGVAYGRTVS